MKRSLWIIQILVILSLMLSACGAAPTSTPTSAPIATDEPAAATPTVEVASEDVLYVNITWHQHQPLYYKDENGVYTRPWVRFHATKDYYDMAAILEKYPNVHVTFNITPVLIRQLDDFASGAKDLYWTTAEIPAADLTDDEKRFILTRFFDANWKNVIARFPRYQELLDKRGGSDDAAIAAAMESFTEQDFRDLQVWINLAWFDPDFLAQEPLKALVDKGGNFTEEDKAVVFDEAVKVIQMVLPEHKKLQDAGQIEVITTPYSHPILPLLVDSDLAKEGNPSADLPTRFQYAQDAVAQLTKSVEMYTEHFGQAPAGLWPGEGSVAQEIVPFVIKAGYKFMQTGEPVLAKSLGIDFTRDTNEVVQQADDLYRPYYVKNKNGDKLAVFFRDGNLSDKVGFTYSGLSGEGAAKDLIRRLEAIKTELADEGATGPHIVSIILDGENAWENYQNDGKDFFNALYQGLSESTTLKTITPSEYLKMFPEQREIEDLFPAAWFSANYDTWIGESEETMAWNYLNEVRTDLAKYDITKTRTASAEAIAKAQDFMYLAEGSDWFWWYGSDQDSGQDTYFDQGFRALLAGVYESLGEPVPTFVNVPIIQATPVAATTALTGLSTPTINGVASDGEWAAAAVYDMAGKTPINGFSYTLDAKNLYFNIQVEEGKTVDQVGLYFVAPRATSYYPFARSVEGKEDVLLGVAATHLMEWSGGTQLDYYQPTADGWFLKEAIGSAAKNGSTLEIAVPLTAFGELEAGDDIRLVTVAQPDGQIIPAKGPVQITVPELGTSVTILEVEDPEGDDNGPGTYTYPSDTVFQSKVFDLKSFKVATDEKNLIFKFAFYGPITNPWGSGYNFSLQTLDVYIDKDPGAATGARLLLPGRNAALTSDNGWEYAVWAEGWTPQVLSPDPATLEPIQITTASMKILADAGQRTITVRIPLDVFGGGDPAQWGYTAVVLSQEGYPSTGVWRVRDVEAKGAQWKIGGAPTDTNHTRILDMIWPADQTPSQAEMLGTYTGSTADIATLTADDFGQLGVLVP